MVQQKTREEQTEEHHQATDQVGNSSIPEHNADEQTDIGGRQVEQYQDQLESEELGPCRDQSGHGVDNDTHDDGWEEAQRHNIKHDLGRKVCDGVVVSVGTLTNKQKSFCRKDRETGQGTEAKQGQDEEEQTQTVLETLDVVGQAVEEIPG